MVLALAVATLAVLFGLLLGLAPAVSQRALGPLRTLALTAVVAVVLLHLLPEALRDLGGTGLCAFAAGLAFPRWLSALRPAHSHEDSAHFGLEVGFWGLLVHHLGDGLALGAYSLVDRKSGHPHTDVLFALVLHTVPLVAVVAAGYARARGVKSAIVRSAELALASVVGVLLSRLVPVEVVDAAKSWIAAGVSGLLVHGLTHDLERDLPKTSAGRAVDLAMALLGATLGWLGEKLEFHGQATSESPVFVLLRAALERMALPLLVSLLLGALLSSRRSQTLTSYADAAAPERGGVLSPEAFLTTLVYFGFGIALLRDFISFLALPLRQAKSAPAVSDAEPTPPPTFLAGLGERIDGVVAWAVLGALLSAVIRASVAEGALRGSLALSIAVAIAFSVSVPLHAVAALQLAFALIDRGFSLEAGLIISVLAPFAVKLSRPQSWVLVAIVTGLALGIGPLVPRALLFVDSRLTGAALLLVCALILARAYRLGFRRLLRPLLAPT